MPTAAPTRNHWPDSRCAKAFWGQHDLPPYKQLLADTLAWAAPQAGESWLDLGCGGGAVSRGLWEASGGTLASVVGLDCAAVNEGKFRQLRETLTPSPGHRVRFVCHDFSSGLQIFDDRTFDHAVSGLSITYAESFDEVTGQWTQDAYDRILREVCRVLKPGGRFVVSVNVPEPVWGAVAMRSLGSLAGAGRPLLTLKRAWRMMRYGAWLKREARTGRFHYLPRDVVAEKLRAAGFVGVESRLSYAGQAFVFRATKPSGR